MKKDSEINSHMTGFRNLKTRAFSIDALVDDLHPVSPISLLHGAGAVAGIVCVLGIFIYFVMGFRADVVSGTPDTAFFVRLGTLLLTGIATGFAAMSMGRPTVVTGTPEKGTIFWKWAVAAALLYPASLLISIAIDSQIFIDDFHMQSAILCLGTSIVSAALIGGVMTLWMRRGAPVNLERAGLLIGLSAGSMGAAVYSLHCPFSTIGYSAVWFTLAVVICGGLGRLVVPPLIRW